MSNLTQAEGMEILYKAPYCAIRRHSAAPMTHVKFTANLAEWIPLLKSKNTNCTIWNKKYGIYVNKINYVRPYTVARTNGKVGLKKMKGSSFSKPHLI